MKWLRLFDPPTAEQADASELAAKRASANLGEPNAPSKTKKFGAAEALLRRVEWTTLRRLDGLLHGDYRTLMRGVGLDLSDLREYQAHDDVRHIDWNVTARMQTPYVRQFTEDRDMNAWFLVDLSASSNFTSGASSKRDLSIEYVAMMARLLTHHGNRVGAMLYGNYVDKIVPPKANRRHVLDLIHGMLSRPLQLVKPRDASSPAQSGTQLGVLLERAMQSLKRRSTVFIVSDFISEDGWQSHLTRLCNRHDVVVVRIDDPLERELPNVGLMTLEDSETGEQMFVDTTNAALRTRYAALAKEREHKLATTFTRAGIDVLRLATDQRLVDNVIRFVEQRKRAPRRRGEFRARSAA